MSHTQFPAPAPLEDSVPDDSEDSIWSQDAQVQIRVAVSGWRAADTEKIAKSLREWVDSLPASDHDGWHRDGGALILLDAGEQIQLSIYSGGEDGLSSAKLSLQEAEQRLFSRGVGVRCTLEESWCGADGQWVRAPYSVLEVD